MHVQMHLTVLLGHFQSERSKVAKVRMASSPRTALSLERKERFSCVGFWGWGLIRRIELLDSHHWLQLANYKKLPISHYKYYTNTLKIFYKYFSNNTIQILQKCYEHTIKSSNYTMLPISCYIPAAPRY